MTRRILVVLSALVPSLLSAQGTSGAVASIRPHYDRIKSLYIRSAEAMPEAKYGFRPSPDVRTYAELLGHVANETYMFCADALGIPDPNKTNFEKVTSQAQMTAGLKAAFAFCDAAYAMPDARAMEQVESMGGKGTRLWLLIYNVTHDSEHYGNIVTYLRINGVVPPSSRPAP